MTDDREVLATLSGGIRVVRVQQQDIPATVAMLIDDGIGKSRETDPADTCYHRAFADIDADPHQLLVIALDASDIVCGTLQLTFVPGLSRIGSTRVILKAVRVAATHRGSGLGTELIRWTIDYSLSRGAAMVQLTTDHRRVAAQRFYQRLGFEDTHLGMKLILPSAAPVSDPG